MLWTYHNLFNYTLRWGSFWLLFFLTRNDDTLLQFTLQLCEQLALVLAEKTISQRGLDTHLGHAADLQNPPTPGNFSLLPAGAPR